MELGIHFVTFAAPGGPGVVRTVLADTARAAERGGCTLFTLADHWFGQGNRSTVEDPVLEGYTSLGFLAGQTERISLGLLVTGVTYRHPGLLAKTVTTLDVLSGGRAVLGLGAAWYEREHVGLGVPFPPLRERFERLAETLEICRQMWSEDNGPYRGRHYQLAETLCSPPPIQQPGPTILIGGGGERQTLRLVARHADAWNVGVRSLAEYRHKIRVLTEHCAAVGRDPATIRRTIGIVGDPLADLDNFLSDMAKFARLGVDLVSVAPMAAGLDPVVFAERAGAELVPRLAELG